MNCSLRAVLFAASLALPRVALAEPVAIGDPSFEGNSLSPGQYSNNLGPEWQETNGPNNPNAFEEYIVGFAADGTDHLGMSNNHNVWQDLGVTYQPNTRYTLTVAIGHRNGNTQSGNQSQYRLADDTGTVYAEGIANAWSLPPQSFDDAPSLVFDTPSNPAAVGKTIRILLRARGGGRSHFDHIRLDAAPLVPAGGATVVMLPATEVTATGATLHGEITDIGDEAPAVTFFWGAGNGGLDPLAWEHSLDLTGTWDGAFSAEISGLAPGTSYFFAARATNSAGASWAVEPGAFETAPLPPEVETLAATGIGATTATLGAVVSSTGGEIPAVTIYYGPADGGTDAGAWAASVDLGQLDDAGSAAVSGLVSSTVYHFRAFAANSGGGAWASSSLSFSTATVTLPVVENRSVEGITGTTANLRGEVTDTGNDAPLVTIFHGATDGGTDPEAWDASADAGVQTGTFTRFTGGLVPETTYYFRSRAANAAGIAWAPESGSFTTGAVLPDAVVINEFHYKPADKTSLEEFIELHNPGDSDADLSGWTLSDAVSYTFPAGTSITAGGYLVVAEAPAVIQAKYGVPALGPWNGKLNSTGERIDLRDAGNVLRDRVDYGVGFPWPTGPDGAGNSAELIHPSLDNDLGGSWRASGSFATQPVTYIASQTGGWRYRKGTAEASNPVTAWRETAYDDSDWLTGQTGIGYNDPGVNTELPDMRNNYRSVYFRKEFTVPADDIPDRLRLRIRMDDGCVIWINGVEVHRLNVAAGQLPYNYLAPQNHENAWEEVILQDAGEFLFGGTNVIAVHGFNTTDGSSDFSMDLELSSMTSDSPVPTPGSVNSVHRGIHLIPPQIRQVNHSPRSPASGQQVIITARLTDPDSVGPVSLSYQTVDPGAYIRLTDPAYATSWTTVEMYDDGSNGDAVAGDSIFTARIPAAVQTNRRLVRYRISFEDGLGNAQTVPYADDEQPNFAYYVHDGVPAWQGAFRPGTTPLQTYPADLLDDLPVYTLIANGGDVINSQYSSGFDSVRFRGTFVSDGVVYDHIEFRNRGEASTYVSGKNKWRFFFNRARDLPVKDNFRQPHAETWGSLTGNACASPWAAVHRGMAGVDEALPYRTFHLAGLPSPSTHYYHFRVVRGATETPPAGTVVNDPIGNADGQYAGDFWGLYLAIEQPRGSFLDERGLPDGSVYKIEGNAGDKKSQGATHPVDSSGWNAFRNAHVNGNPDEAWWRANMDMGAYHTFHAISRLTGNVDLRGGYNHYFYHRSTDNRWVPIPWDLDMMFIARSHWTTNIDGANHPGVIHAHKSLLQHPALALEFRNRAREILDLMASDPSPGGGQIGQLIDEFAQIVNPAGLELTWADADAAMWNLHPRTQGSDSNPSGQSNHRGNFFRSPYSDSRMGGGWNRWLRAPGFSGTAAHEDFMDYLRGYTTDAWPGGFWQANNGQQLGYGYQYLASEAADIAIPAKPAIVHTGDPDFPVSDLSFSSSAFSDPQGEWTYAACEWRIAEISGPGVPGYVPGTPRKYEIHPSWTSGEIADPPGAFTLPFGIVETGKTYRVRVRHKDDTGRWSHWSDPVQFGATEPQAGELLHYWNFNQTGSFLSPTQTIGGGSIVPVVTGNAEVIPHSAQDQGFAALNARNGDPVGSHLRVNNPLGASFDIAIPTTGHDTIVVKYETRRSGQGAGIQRVSYTIDGENWLPYGDIIVIDAPAVVQVLDFRGIAEASNNPAFALRIGFLQGAGGTAGNNRFDNLTVEGEPGDYGPPDFVDWRNEHFTPEELDDPTVSGPEASAADDGVANVLRYALGVGPYDPVDGLLPVLEVGDPFVFRFRHDPAKPDLVWRVKVSADLADWSQAIFDSSIDPLPEPEDGWLAVELPPGPGPRMFARLEVELVE